MDNVSGKYVYFLDSDDFLESTALSELYRISEDECLDMVMFKLINYDGASKKKYSTPYFDMDYLTETLYNKVFNYKDLGRLVYRVAVTMQSTFFNFDLISNLRFIEGVIFEDNPFFIEALFNSNNVYFYDEYLCNKVNRQSSIVNSSFKKFSDCIFIANQVFDLAKKYNHYEEFKGILFYRKFNSFYVRYSQVTEEYKEEFYNKIREDFLINKEEYEKEEAFQKLSKKFKKFFYEILKTTNHEDFDKNMGFNFIYNQNHKYNHMNNRDEKNNFTFSIIIPIYNVEKYLKQSIDSVISQSLDFEEHVQLILVDDGSTDNSLNIAKDYQKKFPNNILVISQENRGPGFARNQGLEYVEGTYVNFLDSDDYISPDTLKEVRDFFERHGDDIDLVSIKICTFERKEDEHPLNFKFNKNKIIDLVKEPNNPQLHVSSSFIKASSLKNRKFKVDLLCSEDTNFVCKLLLDKKKFGVLKSPTYFYRKRMDNTSILDSNISKKDYFTYRLKNHFMDVIEYCLEKEGEVPSFIQYTLAYNIQWMVTPVLPRFFSEDEKEEFMQWFNKVLSYLSADALSSRKLIRNAYLRNYLIYKHYNSLYVDFDFENNEVLMKSEDMILDKLSNYSIWIKGITFNDYGLIIHGSFNSMFNPKNLLFQAFKENKSFGFESYSAVSTVDKRRKETSFYSETMRYLNSFVFYISLKESCKITLSLVYRTDENISDVSEYIYQFPKISFLKKCIINNQNRIFAHDSGNIIFFKNNAIRVIAYEDLHTLVEDSGLFDETYYINQLNDVDETFDPIDHYLQDGYLDGLNPSKRFNTNSYVEQNNLKDTGINPLIHYILLK